MVGTMKRNGRRTRIFPPRLQREYAWAFRHYHELARRYPEQWVAFANRRVIVAGPKLMQVLEQAHEQLPGWPEVPHLFVERGIHIYLYAH